MIQQLWAKLTDHLDPFLFAIVTTIAALGLLVLYSATNETFGRVTSQSQKVIVGPSRHAAFANRTQFFSDRLWACRNARYFDPLDDANDLTTHCPKSCSAR